MPADLRVPITKLFPNKGIELKEPINIHADDESAFRWSCESGHLEVAKWLCEICEDYQIEIVNNIIKYTIKNSLEEMIQNKEIHPSFNHSIIQSYIL